MVEGWSEEHGLLCVACDEPLQDKDKVVPVYEASLGNPMLPSFLSSKNKVYASTRTFPLFAHLKCNK